MTDYPLVSCLMPTMYARRSFWPRALAMFAEQDYPNKELVIVEDGEGCDTESARHIIATLGVFGFRYERFDGTLGAKLNTLAGIAKGAILINWDDDDWSAPNRISTQVAHLQLSGKPVTGLSSLIYYAEGAEHGWEYTGDAWYASGSTHAYRRDYVLAHPRPDKTVGEDNDWIAEAHRRNALSTLSGATCLVACDHPHNSSARNFGFGDSDLDSLREAADNFRKVPLSEFAHAIGPYGSH